MTQPLKSDIISFEIGHWHKLTRDSGIVRWYLTYKIQTRVIFTRDEIRQKLQRNCHYKHTYSSIPSSAHPILLSYKEVSNQIPIRIDLSA